MQAYKWGHDIDSDCMEDEGIRDEIKKAVEKKLTLEVLCHCKKR